MQVVIVANGPTDLPESFHHAAGRADHIIAADGGANLCNRAGCLPHTLIGDLDSIDTALLNDYQRNAITILRHPARKNATDLELALDLALTDGAKKIDLFGAVGGRWDMSLSNIMLACQEKYRHISVIIHDHATKMQIFHHGVHDVNYDIGARLSLLAIGGDAHGVSLDGFEYPLRDATIALGSSRGLSNVVVEKCARIAVQRGILALICSEGE